MMSRFGLGLAVIFALATLGCSKKAVMPQHTEEVWLVRTAATDLVRLAAFAGGKIPPDSGSIGVTQLAGTSAGPVFEVSFPRVDGGSPEVIKLTVATDVLDSAVYAPLGAALAADYSLKSDETPYGPRAAEALTAFTVDALMAENQRISAFLSEHPASVAANEDAAVLLGVFAMRDNAGVFWNPLAACARSTAFQALARSLKDGAGRGADAVLADLFGGLILDTKAKCQGQIDALDKLAVERPGLRPWVAVSRFRNTRDWRPSAGTTLVEKVEKFRAMCDAAGTGPGLKYLAIAQPEDVPDWARVVMETSNSVEDGHQFTAGMVAAEISEAAKVLGVPAPRSRVEAAAFVDALNIAETPVIEMTANGARRIAVIDHAMWAQNAQRHLCHAIYETWNFLQNLWGVPDQAAAFWSEMNGDFGDLRLFPVVGLLRSANVAEVRPYVDRMKDLFVHHPELVPDLAWGRKGAARYPSVFPNVGDLAAAWFTPPLPAGTAYGYATRAGLPHFGLSDEQLEALYRIAPLQQAVVVSYLHAKAENGMPEAQLVEAAGPLIDYCLPVIRLISSHGSGDPGTREKLLVAATQISPDNGEELAKFYLQENQPEKAAVAYQAFVDGASDRVVVSNSCQWLVDYYYEHGQKDKAVQIAKMAAEVYSYRGLETYASLLERMGDLKGAEENFGNIAERYEDGSPLYLFYTRHELVKEFGDKAKKIESETFPSGIQDAKLQDFSGAPKAGVSINEDGPVLRENGLHVGDIIVAIEGKRVDTFPQYVFIRNLSDVPTFQLIVYHNGSYREVQAKAENRKFNVEMTTLK